jgi:hypothetical protein
MKLQHIELSQLKLSPVNVRKRGAEDDLAELIGSIRSLGGGLTAKASKSSRGSAVCSPVRRCRRRPGPPNPFPARCSRTVTT